MSTPITHNQLFAMAAIQVANTLQEGGEMYVSDAKQLALDIIEECTALYNYPDAVQAVRREDGTILSRRVTHFETAKHHGFRSNSHKLFAPEFLQGVDETMTVSEDDYHDTADQAGDVIGQYTDWYTFFVEKNRYMAENRDNRRALLLAELFEAHLAIADWENDRWFRKYTFQCANGSVMIGNKKFSEEEKKEAFGIFKNLLMKLQRNTSMWQMAPEGFVDEDVDSLNAAIEQSYRDAYSPWLANNTLKYVQKVEFEDDPVADEELAFLEEVGLDLDELYDEAEYFTIAVVEKTADKLYAVTNLMECLR